VVEVIARVQAAERDLDEAKEKKLTLGLLNLALHDARTAERHAVSALGDHKKEHGCANIAAR
jgi:hypothetical protein